VRDYAATGTAELGWLDPWLDKVRDAAAAGRTYRRVRVVSVPLTEYARYSLWVSRLNVDAGEEIRYLARDQAPAGLVGFDYWLFDSRTAARMHFDDDDILLGFELVADPAAVVELNYWRDAAWHRATSRGDFAAQHLDQR